METGQEKLNGIKILISEMLSLNKLQDFYEETGELSLKKWKNFYNQWKTVSDKTKLYQGACLSKVDTAGYLLDVSYNEEKDSSKRQELVSAEISCQIESLSDCFLYFNVHLYLKLSYADGSNTCFPLKRNKGKYKAITRTVFDAENLTINSKDRAVQIEKVATFVEVVKLCENVINLTKQI